VKEIGLALSGFWALVFFLLGFLFSDWVTILLWAVSGGGCVAFLAIASSRPWEKNQSDQYRRPDQGSADETRIDR
jgi:mannose/fructose/N-acetylgalactosamine-specific phosphotransferase system component IIC